MQKPKVVSFTGHTSQQSKGRYRPEIDGLRAFALVAVIVNHFNKDVLPSGYLGVDIFFVISGYVITSSLAGKKSNNLLVFLTGFYERRIKRLVPALLFFALITSVLICFFNPNPDWALKTGATSLFGLSNLYLLKHSIDYFAQSTEFNPFTHTWSLGVEEQFYLLFPLLVWFTGYSQQNVKGARNLFFCVVGLAIGSLIGFVYLNQINQSAAYFLMPTRFWEIAAGCLTCITFQKRVRIEQELELLPPLLVVAAMVGVMLLPLSAAVPGTLGIVMLTSILIASLKKGTAAYHLFTLKKVVFIGLISYSLYLWHWTVLSISRWTIGIHWWTVPIQVAVMLMAAVVSYKWIETPLRRSIWALQSWKTIGIGLFYSANATLLLFSILRLSAYNIIFLGSKHNISPGIDLPYLSYNQCNIFEDHLKAVELSSDCGSAILKGRPTLYSLGDSHSEQFNQILAQYAKHKQYNYIFVWGNGCLFPSSVVREGGEICFERQKLVEQAMLRRLKKDDIVFIGNALYGSFNENWFDGANYYTPSGALLNNVDAARIFSRRFQELANLVASKDAKIILYIDSVQFPGLLTNGDMCKAEWFRPQWQLSNECFHDLREHIRVINQNYPWRHEWANGKSKIVWNAFEYTRSCSVNICNASRYQDSNHFKRDYAAYHFYAFARKNPSLFAPPPRSKEYPSDKSRFPTIN